MSLHNAQQYKKALVIVSELEKILKIINASESSLRAHEKYRPVQHILTTIEAEKPILELFLEQYKIIVETKGQIK